MKMPPGCVQGKAHQAKRSVRSREQAFRSIGSFLARIHRRAVKTAADHAKEFLLCQRPMHCQNDARCDFLHEMTSFDQTAVWIVPTPSNGEPVLQDHRHQFGVDLTEKTHALLTAPAINLRSEEHTSELQS